MSRPIRLQLLTFCSLLAACGGVEGQGDYDSSNGIDKRLKFSLLPNGMAAAGSAFSVSVVEGHAHNAHCGFDETWLGTPSHSCQQAAYGIESVVSASCTGISGCKVVGTRVAFGTASANILADEAGTAQLQITLRLLNGAEETDRFDVPFAKVTALNVRCGTFFFLGTQICPGPHAIIDGAEIRFLVEAVAVDAAGAPAEVAPSLFRIRADGTSLKTLGFNTSATWPAQTTVYSDGPGFGTVHFSVGSFDRAYPVRVVAPSEVRELTPRWLRYPTQPYLFAPDGWFAKTPDVAADPVLTDPIPTTVSISTDGGVALYAPPRPVVDAQLGLVATLADGSYALGGGGTLHSSSQVVELSYPSWGRDPPDSTWAYFELAAQNAGTATISGSMGSATVSFPIRAVP